MNKLSPFKWFCLQNFPFIEADFDALTNYELMCKVYEYVSKIATKTNELGEEVEALAHYIENLDIQDEVDKKLDEMAESGELAEIMAGYLNQRAIFSFNSVSAMKSAENLVGGSYAETYGYYEPGDMGNSRYLIREITNQDTPNDMDIIAIGDGNLVAEFIPTNDRLNIRQFGAKLDYENYDDSDIIQFAIDYIKEKYTSTNYASSELILDGNSILAQITKTLYFPHNLRVENLYLAMYTGTYDRSYACFVNIAPNSTDWIVSYPRENLGYFENVRILNMTENNYNGIFNASNNTFNRMSMNHLDRFFLTAGFYLDFITISNSHFTQKLDTTNYGIDIGYLGDCLQFKHNALDCHNVEHTNNLAINLGGSSNSTLLLDNIIMGKIQTNQGIYNIENLHTERGTIECNGSAINMSNIYIWKQPTRCIALTNRTTAKISNLRVLYRYLNTNFDDYDDIDIAIDTTSNAIIENSCKYITGSNITGNIKAGIRTNKNIYPSTSLTTKFENNFLIQDSYYPFNDGNINSGVVSDPSVLNKWKKPSGTYYYKVIKMLDFQRELAYTPFNKTFSVTLTNNQGGMRIIDTNTNKKWRLYRGTEEGVYTEYVDIFSISGDILDDGIMCNGNKWRELTSTTLNNGRNYIPVSYDNSGNIKVGLSSAPSTGTWRYGDIYETTTKSYRCTAGNVPGGSWLEI